MKRLTFLFLIMVMLLVSGLTVTPTEAAVNVLGSWVTGTTHAKESGTDRALIFIAHAESASTINLSAVTYGGQAMTKVVDYSYNAASGYAYAAAFILKETGVAAASSSTFSVTWGGTAPGSSAYSSVFLSNVDQTTATGATGTGGSTSNPVTTSALGTSSGDMVILAATCGNAGSYTLNNSFIEGTDQQFPGGATGVTGRKSATGANETPSATYSGTINRQMIIGLVVKATGGTTPTLSVSPTSVSVAAAAGSTGTFNITSNTSWTVSDDQSWLTVSPTSGSNNATVTVTAQENTGSARSATVTVSATGVASQTVTVTQAAAGVSTSIWLEAECASLGSLWNTVSDSTASNSYYVTIQSGNNSTTSAPTNSAGYIDFPLSVSQSGTYYLFLRVKCPTASDDSFWVRMDGGSWVNWNNNTTTSWAWRQFTNTFSLSAGSHTLTIAYREDGAQLDKINLATSSTLPTGTGETAENLCTPGGPTLSVSPTSVSVAAAAGSTGTFNITSNVSWTVSDDQTWLTVSPTSGSNNATVTVTAQENTNTSTRSATVTVSGTGVASQTVTVTQAAASTPTLSVSPTSVSVAAAAGSTGTFNITSNTSWTVSDNQTWLTVSPTSGSNNATVTVTAQENTGETERTATVTVSATGVASQTVTVTQAAGGETTTVSINCGGSATGSFTADQYYSGGSTYTITRTIDTSQITGDVPPVAVFQSERYNQSTYTIPNLLAGSVQMVTLYFAETYVTSSGARLFNVSINGTTVLSNFDIYAEAGGQDKAIARTFSTTANSSGQVVIQFIPGTIQNPKICGITVTGSSGPILYASPTSLSLAAAAGSTGTFNIYSNVSWTVSDNQTWLTVSPTSGSNNGTVTVTAQENTNDLARTATVTVSGAGVSSQTVTVTQSGAGIGCDVPPMPSFSSLPTNAKLPNPFTFMDGTPVTTQADWECRRAEIAELIQEFESGYKPATPYSATTATYNGSTLTVTVNDNGTQISFNCSVSKPSGTGPFPVLLTVGGSSLGTVSGVATVNIPNDDIAQQNSTSSRGVGKFYTMYGSSHSASAMMAWAWGASRVIDAIEKTASSTNLDPTRIAVTGCSRNGKGALMCGAFDDRIDLTLPQESGSGGSASWRVSHYMHDVLGQDTQELCEIVGENVWFRANFNQFCGNEDKLPTDHHELIGLVAPRAIYIIDNNILWLGPESSWNCANAAKTIWTALGVPDKFGYSCTTGHTHCVFPSSQQTELNAYVGKYLIGGGTGTTGIMRCDPGFTYDAARWVDWTTPTLP